jgi:hypothetical protein
LGVKLESSDLESGVFLVFVLPEAARVIEFMLSDEEGRKMDF